MVKGLLQPLTRYRPCVAGRVSDGARQNVEMCEFGNMLMCELV